MTRRLRTLIPLLLGTLITAPATAQERPRIWVNGQEINPLELIAGRRARIGVSLDMYAAQNDSIGATIAAVTPNGPAARAGLRSEDIITRFNGRSLVDAERDRDERGEESLAALRLIEMVARLEPGDTVSLEYRRGRDTRTATVVTAWERDFAMGGAWAWPRFDPQGGNLVRLRGLPSAVAGNEPGALFFKFGGPLAEMEFASLNDDLGAYFGTTDGVLVIDAPPDNPFGLKGGDVILTVDGRAARGPSSLHRILATYEEGEVVELEIMRNKARQTISSKIARDQD